MLKGMAKGKIEKGKTPRFPITNHIITKPIIQLKTEVSTNENFLLKIKTTIAKTKAQIPQIAPFIGCSGKICPCFW